jgi:hypothetical protein
MCNPIDEVGPQSWISGSHLLEGINCALESGDKLINVQDNATVPRQILTVPFRVYMLVGVRERI